MRAPEFSAGKHRRWSFRLKMAVLASTFFSLAALSAPQRFSSQQQLQNPAPLWTVDLSQYGAEEPGVSPERTETTSWLQNAGITFTKPDIFAAYFTRRGPGGKLSRRDQPAETDPFHLTVVFFDAASGREMSTIQWSTDPSRVNAVYGARDGKFIVSNGDSLDLYSPSLQLEKHLSLGTPGRRVLLNQHLSPDGKSLLLTRRSENLITDFTLLRTSDFSKISEWSGDNSSVSTYGDAVVWATDSEVVVRPPNGIYRVVYRSGKIICSVPSFLNQNAIVFEEVSDRSCEAVRVIFPSGKSVAQDFKGELLNKTISSSSGGTGFAFAFASAPLKGFFKNPLSQKHIRIRIYDAKLGKWQLVLDGIQPQPRYLYRFTLSPDGSLLAVLSDTILSVYRTN